MARMDDIVRQAMAKWPTVPHCRGWLGLDARGQWSLRDEQAQAAGPFAGGVPAARGSVLQHDKLIAFIGRNYSSDAAGQWYFQNGPQRVFVELEITPWIWRVDGDFSVSAHTGMPARPQRCFVDEIGRVYLETEAGFGLVHSLDMLHAADAIESGLWVPESVCTDALPARFGYVLSPQAAQAQH
jgi:Protein of unknown function (DUF2946)